MNKKTLLGAALLLVSLAPRAQQATFSYFSYQGDEPRFRKQIDAGREFFNPILAGFYPDPSICRVGDTYYMVNSSFSFFPGVPLSTSKDLVHWTPAGHVLDRPSQVPLARQKVSGGIFAPAISYNPKNKTFYMITTNVGAGNFYVKSKDPTKGWSEPIYLRKIDGIDPSFFFDKDGAGYIVHNAPVDGGASVFSVLTPRATASSATTSRLCVEARMWRNAPSGLKALISTASANTIISCVPKAARAIGTVK